MPSSRNSRVEKQAGSARPSCSSSTATTRPKRSRAPKPSPQPDKAALVPGICQSLTDGPATLHFGRPAWNASPLSESKKAMADPAPAAWGSIVGRFKDNKYTVTRYNPFMRVLVLGNAGRPGVRDATDQFLPFLRQHAE